MTKESKNLLPKVTIVTTVWNLYENNRVETFRQMMESVHSQTYSNIEHLVVDNNSTDETKKLIQEYVIKGYITKTCFEKKQGLWHGMNRGIKEASGEFINFMNSDDYFYRNDAVELSISAILKENADWSFGWSNKINSDTGAVVFKWYFDDYASIYNARCPNHQTLFVRTKLLREQGGFATNPEFGGTFSDDLSMMRLLFSGHIPAVVPEVLVVFRDGGASSNIGRFNAYKYAEYVREEFGFYEISAKDLMDLYWENRVRKIDEISFENILNKITIPAWRERLVAVYGKDFPLLKAKTLNTLPIIPQISIIVPVYNAECTIRRGIYSLLNQSFENIEILCINDGSTDNSLKILEELQKKDARIKVFDQENAGPAVARNVGLKNSQGKYIMFMDADDTFHPDMCKKMLETIEKHDVDVVMCDTNMIGKDYGNYPFQFGAGKFDINCHIRKYINVWLWNKIFKAHIIKENEIFFPAGHKSDDDVFIAKYFAVAKKLYCLDQKLINHYQTENSIMNIYYSEFPNKKDIFDRIFAAKFIVQFIKKYQKGSLTDDDVEYLQHIFKTQIYYAWRNVGSNIENEFLDLLKECIADIGIEFVGDKIIAMAIIQNEYCVAVNLLDYFAENFTKIKRRKYLFQNKIEPVFNDNYVPIVFSANDKYCKYLSVALQSIIETSSKEINYDIIILEDNISDINKQILFSQIPSNFSLRFYNMNGIIEKYQLKSWYYTGRLSPVAYFRLFIPEVLENYKKCIYFDVDIIVLSDVYNLFQIAIDDVYLGVVRDILQTEISKQRYFSGHLKMKDPKNNYFNSGVLLMNLEKINSDNLMQKFLFFGNINNQYYHDQNVLNASCENKVKYISPQWNMITSAWYYKDYHMVPFEASAEYFFENMNVALSNSPKLIHYATWTKPWQNPYIPMAWIWWKIAIKSPYYSMLMVDLHDKNRQIVNNYSTDISIIKDIANYSKNRFNYYRCRLLANVTFGKMRKHYKNKKKELKAKIKAVRRFLKS